MKHFYVWNFNRKRRWMVYILLAAILMLILLTKPMNVLHVFLNQDELVMSKGNDKDKKIALTFNISWGDEKVYDILEVLKAQHTVATFFLSGEWAERHPQIVEKIQEDQHEIGMLGYRYKNYEDGDLEQLKKDMMYAKEVFRKMDIDTSLMRPPSGVFNPEKVKIAEDLGLKVVHWSVNPNDLDNPGTKKLVTSLTEQTSNGDIILLHASDAAKQTADALRSVLPHFQDKNLDSVPISTLIDEISVKEKLIE